MIESISTLIGKILTDIQVGSEEIVFTTVSGETYKLFHSQDCCESVRVESVVGEVDDLLNTPILDAYETSNTKEHPSDLLVKDVPKWVDDSFTWTFYRLTTIKGSVTIRWFGSSNGYYSESVSFKLLKDSKHAEEDWND